MVIVSITPEIGLDQLYTYAGGLGVLEGDKFLHASRKGYDYIVLTLLYRYGYVDYRFNKEDILPKPQTHPVPPHDILAPEEEFKISLKSEEVIVRPWTHRVRNAKIVYFEPVCPMWARSLVDRVYIEKNEQERYYKYIFLAKASAEYIRERIGLKKIDVIDIQEAYGALIVLSLPEYENYRFITHTPGPWGHPFYPRKLLEEEFRIKFSGDEDNIMLTKLAMDKSKKIFTVSKKHLEITKQMFPAYSEKISYVTNAVEETRWMHPALKRIINEIPVELELIDPDMLWKAHQEARNDLVKLIRQYKDTVRITENKMIIVWARRLTRYKRPYFIAEFIEEHNTEDVFFVLGGKPHPNDKDGISYARAFKKLMDKHNNVIYVHDYDIFRAKLMLAGGDLLLFTPFPGWEACGTSYMKAGINGVPILASRDGGALELIRDNLNSWFFGSTIDELINIYDDPRAKQIDEKDYVDFARKLNKIINLYPTEKYKEIMCNILQDTYREFTMKRLFSQYYPWIEKHIDF